MRFESSTATITFYYELGGKQEDKLFVARFSYGTKIDEKTDKQFHQEIKSFKTFDELQTYLDELESYCKDTMKFKKVRSKKRNVI